MEQGRHSMFSEEEIQRLFGNEDAAYEDVTRLREYYFKTNVYEQMLADLPLRILVGHKGIGKSALFKVAMAEEQERGVISVLVKPNDVASITTDTTDFLKSIRDWKIGLTEIIARHVLTAVGVGSEGLGGNLQRYGFSLAAFLDQTFKESISANTIPLKTVLIERFLKTHKISVYIDDMDRGWKGRREDIERLSALISAARDISDESRGINFRISLRSDVYYLVRTSDESTDKFEGSVIWHSWTNHQIFVLLVKRIESYFGRHVDEERLVDIGQRNLARYLDPVMEEKFAGEGLWKDAPIYRVLMSLIRRRPRDLVKLCSLAGRKAWESRSSKILTKHFQQSFEEYSQGRLQDTINEFRSELPDIERLLLSMKPAKKEKTAHEGYVYSTDALIKKIGNIIEQGKFVKATGAVADAKALAAFMYKINFLTARKELPYGIVRKYFEENRYLSNEFSEFGFDWEIHPAYRWALQPDDLQSIYKTLALSAEDRAPGHANE